MSCICKNTLCGIALLLAAIAAAPVSEDAIVPESAPEVGTVPVLPTTSLAQDSASPTTAAGPSPKKCNTKLLKTGGASGKTFRCSVGAAKHRIDYHITVPSHCTSKEKCGVIVNTHGQGESAEVQEAHTGIAAAALKGKKYIVIAPHDPTSFWDIHMMGHVVDEGKSIADFVFNKALNVYKDVVDFKRVHTTGYSAGAILSYDLLCRYSEKICSTAGIAFNPQIETTIPGGGPYLNHLPTCFNVRAGGKGPKHHRSLMVHTNTVSDFYFSGKASGSFNNAVSFVKKLYGITGHGEKRHINAGVNWTRYKTKSGLMFEAANYKYTNPAPTEAGHCVVAKGKPTTGIFCGADSDGNKPGYIWGDEVLKFFEANPCLS